MGNRLNRLLPTVNAALVAALVLAVVATIGTNGLLGMLRLEFDVRVPRTLQTWLPFVVGAVVLVVAAFVLVGLVQRHSPTESSTPRVVGSALGVGLAGGVIGGVLAGLLWFGLVWVLAAATAPEAGYLIFLLPLVAIGGGVLGMGVALGRRRHR